MIYVIVRDIKRNNKEVGRCLLHQVPAEGEVFDINDYPYVVESRSWKIEKHLDGTTIPHSQSCILYVE